MSIKVNEIVRGGKRLALLLGVFAMNVCPAETIEGTPDAYLEYVDANGTQYINTGVLPAIGLKARIDLKWTRTKQENGGFYDWSFLDVRGSGDDRFYLLHLNQYNNQYPAVTYGYGTFHKTTMQASSDRHEILSDFSDASAIQIYQNGVPTISASDQQALANTSFTMPNLPLYLFAGNYNGTASWYSSASLYELKMFMKNTETGKFDLIRHYLPCKKNGRAALYDKVEGKIYFSDRSGYDLLAGPELPRPVEMVEWVQSDGKDPQYHWLDTWVYAKSGLRSKVDFIHKDDNQISGGTAIDRCVLGARKTNSAPEADSRFYMAYFYKGAFCYGYRTLYSKDGSNVVEVPAENGNRYLVESDLSVGKQSVKVNGTEIHKDGVAHDDTYFATGNTLTLFAMHEAAIYHKVYSSVRLFSAKIWDGDELLRDFAPCVDSNGKAGLYDSVSERVFYLGKDRVREFDLTNNVGAVTNWLAETAGALPDSKIGYIESDGTTNDYFNLEVPAKDGVEMEAVMEWVTVPTDGAFVGARTDKQVNDKGNIGVRFIPYHHWSDHGSGHRIAYSGQWPGNGAIATAGTKYWIKSHLDDGAQWYTVAAFQNGAWSAPVRVDTAYAGPVDTELPLYLFAVNYDGVPRFPGQSRVYRLKFREKQQNGEYALTRDFVPCKKDGKAMLYDNVSKTFFRNRGRYLAIGGGNERPFETGMFLLLK